MCGLAGIFDSRTPAPVSRDLLIAMRDRMVHRGPDGWGDYVGAGIGLAHRRLAILDLSGGHQPLFNEDGSVAVVFNGEIYNYRELQIELEALGHRFRTHSDTEVIVHGWEEWGADCVRHFSGMFAFALWDNASSTLMLARDRLGKKPLYYTELADGCVLFGSELKALLACRETSRRIDPAMIDDYLCFGYVPDPHSIYSGVSKLPPAHRLIWRRGAPPILDSYWRLRMSEDGPRNMMDAEEELTERFKRSVEARMISDVPLGAFLSGGVDSSGVVALMSGLAGERVKTFCIAFDETGYDESSYAQIIADRYGTDHRVSMADPNDVALIDRLAGMFDEPFGDNSAYPTYQVCALARQGVTVALSGDGGDELFGGYRRYAWHQKEAAIRGLMPAGLRHSLFGVLGAAYPKLDRVPRWLRAKTLFKELAMDPAEAYCNSISVLSSPMRQHLYSDAFRRDLQGYRAVDSLRRHMNEADSDNPLLQVQYADIKMWLAGDILVKVDRMSMAVSLEVRAPLLDHELVEWAAHLPAGMKIHGGQGKYVLKKALEPLVPPDLLHRRKQGFASPLAAWFRGPLAERIDNAAVNLGASGYFKADRIVDLIGRHRSGRSDHGPVLWSLLMLDNFLQHHAGA
jgi:asparagine synthase (glutamine-hydrolysing)